MSIGDLYVCVIELHAWVREYNGIEDDPPDIDGDW